MPDVTYHGRDGKGSKLVQESVGTSLTMGACASRAVSWQVTVPERFVCGTTLVLHLLNVVAHSSVKALGVSDRHSCEWREYGFVSIDR